VATSPIAQCLISFGSNLGNRDALIVEAARLVAASPLIFDLRASRLFETPPIGGPSGQEPFLNAVAAFETTASARQILELLQQTEQRLGRERRQRWGARSIDLDVVLHGELVGGGTGLIVPHPRYTARQFVLQPACDVAAHYRDPRFGWTLERLARHLNEGVPSMALVGSDASTREELCRRLRDDHGIQTFAERPMAEPMAVVGNAPAAVRPPPPATAPSDPTTTTTTDSRKVTGDRDGLSVQTVILSNDQPWVSAFIPPLPSLSGEDTGRANVPRLVARMQSATAETRWPAPHQMWPSGWRWPEYRLEVDDLGWAASEVASAVTSMRCPVRPVSTDGGWAGG
jgi:2-amino-4-hydroxy-6-hydroxymethyldihydropteridine diphosphokinase